MKTLIAPLTALLTAVVSFAVPGPALAQGAGDSDVVLEEILVTARKREENLQEVPISISVFDSDFVADTGVTGIYELAEFTPNLSFRQSYGRTFDRPAIRGQSVILGKNTVGLFVDGVFVQGSISSTPLDNIERVEVIKGPQAALFGRRTMAGAINYITKRPTDEWSTKLTAIGAQHGELDGRIFINGPIAGDTLAFNLGVRHYEYDGEYDNIGPGGGSMGQEQTDSVYGSLYWTPNDKFDALLKVTWFEDQDGHPPSELTVESDELNCFLDSPRGYYCGEVPVPEDMEIDQVPGLDYGTFRETLRTSLEMNYDLPSGITLTSQTAWSKEDEDWLIDFGPEANDFFLFTQSTAQINLEWEYASQELRVTSPADQRLRWMAGAYYYDSDELDPVTLVQEDITNTALFASVGYDFTENLVGTAELRWSEDDIEVLNSAGRRLQDTFDSVTPRFTLTWFQNEGVNYYGSVAKGTKPGGFNGEVVGLNVPPDEQQRLAGLVTYDEEQAWNYEIGTKRTMLDGRVTLNVAAFFIDWDDQQLTRAEPFIDSDNEPNTTTLITNIGTTEIMGLEVFLNARLNEQFDLNFAYGYTDAEIQEQCDVEYGTFFGPDPDRCDQVQFPGGASVAGNTTPNAPEHNLSVSLAYNRDIGGNREFFARGDYLYESTRYSQVFNLAETGDSSRINLRAGLAGDQWRATLWVKNLTDDRTANSVIRIVDFDTIFFGLRRAFLASLPRGRQYGVSLEYNF